MSETSPPERIVIVHSDPLVGRSLAGRFRVQRLLARGGTGRVYRAEQTGLRRPVALKILDAGQDPQARHRFIQEATTLARLSHPNTVRVIDAGSWEGIDYIAMEYVPGQTLKAALDKGRMPVDRALSIARQICGSLIEAHRLGIVHRDLKPGNVILSERDGELQVKVVDFGLVKHLDGSTIEATAIGRIMGSPLYMSPEQIRGGTVDARTDLYALGGMLYHMLTGQRPFPHHTTAAVLMAHLMSEPPAFASVDPGLRVPPCLEETVLRCLEKDPLRRFPDAAALDAALARCEAAWQEEIDWDSPLSPEPPARPAPRPLEEEEEAVLAELRPRRRVSAPLLAAVALLLVGSGTGLGLISTTRAPIPPPAMVEALEVEPAPPMKAFQEPMLIEASTRPEAEEPAPPSAKVAASRPRPKARPARIPKPQHSSAALSPVPPVWGGDAQPMAAESPWEP